MNDIKFSYIFDTNAQFIYQRYINCEFVCINNIPSDELVDFIHNIDFHLENSLQFYKERIQDTTTVAVAKLAKQLVVIKRYNFKSVFHAIKLQFRKSHCYRSFIFSYFLPKLGISTVRPVALIQKKFFFLKRFSYFISEYENGLPGCQYFADDSPYKKNWPQTIDAIYLLIYKIRENSIYHGDFHFGNLLIINYQPVILDFDRMKIVKYKKKFLRLHLKDLQNFLRYLKRNPIAYQQFKQHDEFERCFEQCV